MLLHARHTHEPRRLMHQVGIIHRRRGLRIPRARLQVVPRDDDIPPLPIRHVRDPPQFADAGAEDPAHAHKQVLARAVPQGRLEDAGFFAERDGRVGRVAEEEVGEGHGGLGEAEGEGVRGEGHGGGVGETVEGRRVGEGVGAEGPAVAVDLGWEGEREGDGEVIDGAGVEEGICGIGRVVGWCRRWLLELEL